MPSPTLSPSELRRLDELLDEWAYWFTRRGADAPGVEAPSWHADALDTSRSWESTYEIEGKAMAALNPLVDEAVDRLPEHHRNVLTTWAWFAHSALSVQRRLKRELGVNVIRSNRQILSAENLEAAKLALVPLLAEQGIYL